MGIAVVLRACADVVMMGSVYGQDCSAGGDSGKRHGSHCQRQEPALPSGFVCPWKIIAWVAGAWIRVQLMSGKTDMGPP